MMGDLAMVAAAEWRAIGTTIRVVVTDSEALASAQQMAVEDLAALDLACSRFRDDSEVIGLEGAEGRPTQVSPLLTELLAAALDAAEQTDGDLDPTLGFAMEAIGYDRDISLMELEGPAAAVTVRYRSNWRQIELNPAMATVVIPTGVRVDLGATAKAWAADRTAARIERVLGCGVLVSFGGDIATAGSPPTGGWTIRVQEEVGNPDEAPPLGSTTVAIQGGGLATSSTMARRWQRGGKAMHHILDPRTGLPAPEVWRTVTVAAPSALAANVASTAAIIRGNRAMGWLTALGYPARLVGAEGEVSTIGGWPTEAPS